MLGFLGWNTTDTPVAKKGSPDELFLLPIEDSGSLLPSIFEKFIPALSKNLPSSIITEWPFPRLSFDQTSLTILASTSYPLSSVKMF